MRTLIINGVDSNLKPLSVLIEDGKITKLTPAIQVNPGDQVIDVHHALLCSGLVDLHAHLREPGFTHKETLKTGTQAAARGGFTTLCAMPNTNPVPDTPERVDAFYERVNADACVHVYTYAPITMSLVSHELPDYRALKNHGAIAFTNDGVGVQDAKVMWDAMKQAAQLNMIVAAHAEDESLKAKGVVHLGKVSERFHVLGISSLSESTQVARDVLLAKDTGCHYHVCHVSSADTVQVIRDAKKQGIKVTAEVTPHHLLLSEEDILTADAKYKMNPPLRSEADRQALIQGLLDGTIDCIATDHAPHSPEEKARGLVDAPFGILGFEYAFGLLYTELVKTKIMSLSQLIHWMTQAPSDVFGLNRGSLKVGQAADIACFDLTTKVVIPSTFVSKSKNSPFCGREIVGDCCLTMVNGNVVWRKESC